MSQLKTPVDLLLCSTQTTLRSSQFADGNLHHLVAGFQVFFAAQHDNYIWSRGSKGKSHSLQAVSMQTPFLIVPLGMNWLDQHNDFEAIVDGANIGLYQQNFADGGFSVPQLEAVVKELYKRSNKWPLVILHEKRLHTLLANPSNRGILEEWIDNGVLYGTPVGSNDDWYWLYASVKLKCMLVTNDEMRDHIFELLGSSFFPMWKERHQVHYTFPKGQVKLEMPPPYSVVIQESERGAWHVPVTSESNNESQRTWLCITRSETCKVSDEFCKSAEARESGKITNGKFINPCSNSSNSSETICITGKRKERSESPTE